MALKKNEKRLLILLGVVIVAVVIFQFVISPGDKKKTPPKRNAAGQAAGGTNAQTGAQGIAAINTKSNSDTAYSAWGRDPFFEEDVTVLAKRSKERSITLKLQGIFFKDGKGYVLINNEVFKEGEEKKGIRVEKIQQDKVLCRAKGRLVTLRWRKP